MKIFISQPMNGLSDEQIKTERNNAIKSCEEKFGKIEIIESYFENVPKVKTIPLYYLGKSLQLMSEADVVYFCKGWENARGCVIENKCAIDYNINIVIEDYKK